MADAETADSETAITETADAGTAVAETAEAEAAIAEETADAETADAETAIAETSHEVPLPAWTPQHGPPRHGVPRLTARPAGGSLPGRAIQDCSWSQGRNSSSRSQAPAAGEPARASEPLAERDTSYGDEVHHGPV